MKEPKDMTLKELKIEYATIKAHIENYGYGRWELDYMGELEKELSRRTK